MRISKEFVEDMKKKMADRLLELDRCVHVEDYDGLVAACTCGFATEEDVSKACSEKLKKVYVAVMDYTCACINMLELEMHLDWQNEDIEHVLNTCNWYNSKDMYFMTSERPIEIIRINPEFQETMRIFSEENM